MVCDLFEVLSKIFSKEFSDQAIMAFSDVFGLAKTCPPVLDSFDKLIANGGFVDTYIHTNPAGRSVSSERFTCWDQYRNERYENKGARIDYVFVDQGVINAVRLAETEQDFLQSVESDSSQTGMKVAYCVSSDRSYALKSATANHMWKPVPFHGGGIDTEKPSATARDFEFIFTNPPQTGIVYTAPIFSDHVGTSCVLDMACLRTEGIDARMNDELGTKWATSLSHALVAPAHKSHSLKDMFLKASRKAIATRSDGSNEQPPSPAKTTETHGNEIIELDDSDDNASNKRKRVN
jgi:hypothetical protein